MLQSRWAKVLVFVLCVMPLAWLGWRYKQDDLTANPVEFITHFTGDWTIRLIVATLSITPLRRLLGLVDLIRFRRMLGLFAFFYGLLHFLTWLWLDKDFSLRDMSQDIVKRPFITAGFVAFALMVPLAITSMNWWVRTLGGKKWQLLHRLVYVTAIAGVVHYYWLVKSDVRWPLFYGACVIALLGARLVPARKSGTKPVRTFRVASIKRETWDTVTLRFALAEGEALSAKPGQFLSFDWIVDGKKMPRSYSISSSPLETAFFDITVKQQGTVSTFINRDAQVGLTVEAQGPFGQFYFDENKHKQIVLFAGGSGITPMMSMLRCLEQTAPATKVLLFYAVHSERDIIFQEEIERLQRKLDGFRCVMAISSMTGRLDGTTVKKELGVVSDEFFFLCGPEGFMENMTAILGSEGVGADRILRESFQVGTVAPKALADDRMYSVEFVNSGQKFTVSAGEALLDGAEKHGIAIPFSCRVGQCGTCATRVLAGEVEMDTEDGLGEGQKAEGYRLMCIGHARSDLRIEA